MFGNIQKRKIHSLTELENVSSMAIMNQYWEKKQNDLWVELERILDWEELMGLPRSQCNWYF